MIQIVALTILFAIIIVYLKSVNSEIALIALVGAGIILSSYAFSYLTQTFDFINKLIELTKIDKGIFKIIFKITAIGYLIEFGAGTINDFGLKSLADKLVFVGKIIILSVSMPIFYALFNLISGLIQ